MQKARLESRKRGDALGRAAPPADAVHFQRLGLGAETEVARLPLDQVRDRALVAHFGRAFAHIADQEWHLVCFRRMLAKHECVDGFQLVDEAVLEQEIQRTIDGGRRRAGMAVAQRFQKIVRLDRLARLRDQLQYFAPQRRQAQATRVALMLDLAHDAGGIVVVMMVRGFGCGDHGCILALARKCADQKLFRVGCVRLQARFNIPGVGLRLSPSEPSSCRPATPRWQRPQHRPRDRTHHQSQRDAEHDPATPPAEHGADHRAGDGEPDQRPPRHQYQHVVQQLRKRARCVRVHTLQKLLQQVLHEDSGLAKTMDFVTPGPSAALPQTESGNPVLTPSESNSKMNPGFRREDDLGGYWFARATASSIRRKAMSRPARYTVSSIDGDTALPVIATRNGCATLPMPMPRSVATSATSAWMSAGFHVGNAASFTCIARNTSAAPSAHKCFLTALSSHASIGAYQMRACSAIAFRVCTRSRNATTTSAGSGPFATSSPSRSRCHASS